MIRAAIYVVTYAGVATFAALLLKQHLTAWGLSSEAIIYATLLMAVMTLAAERAWVGVNDAPA